MLERLLQQHGYISLMPQAVKSSVVRIVNHQRQRTRTKLDGNKRGKPKQNASRLQALRKTSLGQAHVIIFRRLRSLSPLPEPQSLPLLLFAFALVLCDGRWNTDSGCSSSQVVQHFRPFVIKRLRPSTLRDLA